MSRIDESITFIPVRIAVLTVSDTRTEKTDKSGSLLAEMLTKDGHQLADQAIEKDDIGALQARVKTWIEDPEVDVVITSGGTGFTGRDITPEALRPLFEKEIEGFSTAFHMAEPRQDRHLDDPIAGLRRRRRWDVYLLRSRFTRRLQGRLERHPQIPARHSAPALQLRRDHAAADRAFGQRKLSERS